MDRCVPRGAGIGSASDLVIVYEASCSVGNALVIGIVAPPGKESYTLRRLTVFNNVMFVSAVVITDKPSPEFNINARCIASHAVCAAIDSIFWAGESVLVVIASSMS